ncbi:hypothetical protein L0F63_006580, partial [Massospora cicadina]
GSQLHNPFNGLLDDYGEIPKFTKILKLQFVGKLVNFKLSNGPDANRLSRNHLPTAIENI